MSEDNPAAPAPPKRSSSIRDYQRAYKACIPCRNRKARCDLGDRDGPPCVRCRREQRECIFSAERAWASKRQKSSTTPTNDEQPDISYHSQNEDIPAEADTFNRLSSSTASQQTLSQARNQLTPQWTSQNSPRSKPSFAHGNGHAGSPRLSDSMIRTVVSSGSDALQILYEAAAQSDNLSPSDGSAHPHGEGDLGSRGGGGAQGFQHPTNGFPHGKRPTPAQTARSDALRAWGASRFVKMGLFNAEEAITLVDRFFATLSPMTPILTNYYANVETHRQLLTQEPLLCTTILMISSRYHALPGTGGLSRSFLIHDRLWQHCRHLIMKIMFGLEKGLAPKTRTLGSVEALLLLSEWHPRALHFPSETDGWDADLIVTESESGDSDASQTPATQWLEEVTEPARRSDQMSWMLIGCAVTLAHELNLFEDETKTAETNQDLHSPQRRRTRLLKLLYVFSTQMASRLGYTSMFPHHRSHSVSGRKSKNADDWDSFILAWTELTRFIKSSSEMVFPSQVITKQLLQSGRYVGLLEHFRPLLEDWRRSYIGFIDGGNFLCDMLSIDYQYVRVFINSIGMQAVCERALSTSTTSDLDIREGFITSDSTDYVYIQEVIDGSCEILQKVITLAQKQALRYAPIRVFLRITTSSIFLLKAVSLGVRTSQLTTALDLLSRSIEALRGSAADDMHLASPYATLLEMHVTRLRRRFLELGTKQAVPTNQSTRGPQSQSHFSQQGASSGGMLDNNSHNQTSTQGQPQSQYVNGMKEPYQQSGAYMNGFDGSSMLGQGFSADDWLSLPFDPSMAPFGEDILDNNALDFLWNSPG